MITFTNDYTGEDGNDVNVGGHGIPAWNHSETD